MACFFCDRRHDELHGDDRAFVMLHDDWAVRGHAMVVWRAHVENVGDLSADDAAHFAALHHRAERALLDATGADRAILLKLGIATPHLHLHVYPVAASLDRAAVMAIIDAETRVEPDAAFVEELRRRLQLGSPPAAP
jgi:diadenosine tetraphosphate (Ap4A) HIT family hydrolase